MIRRWQDRAIHARVSPTARRCLIVRPAVYRSGRHPRVARVTATGRCRGIRVRRLPGFGSRQGPVGMCKLPFGSQAGGEQVVLELVQVGVGRTGGPARSVARPGWRSQRRTGAPLPRQPGQVPGWAHPCPAAQPGRQDPNDRRAPRASFPLPASMFVRRRDPLVKVRGASGPGIPTSGVRQAGKGPRPRSVGLRTHPRAGTSP